MKTCLIFLIFVILFTGVTQACPTVDPNTTLYWATNLVYDWGTGFSDDYIAAFQVWEALAQGAGGGSWYCYEIFDWTLSNMSLQWGGGEHEYFPFARAVVQYGTHGRIETCQVMLNNIYPWVGGDPDLVPMGYPSALAVLTHELGHVWGAYHSEDVTSCSAFMNATPEYQRANLPTMTIGSQGQHWNWGLFPPYILLHTLAPADIDWANTAYQGVVHNEDTDDPDIGDDQENTPPSHKTLEMSCSPNPFNPEISIEFAVNFPTRYSMRVFNARGEMVYEKRGQCSAGSQKEMWRGRSQEGKPVPSGVYTIQVATGMISVARNVSLVK